MSERAIAGLAAALLVALGGGLALRAVLDAPAPASRRAPTESSWIIPPGREQVALQWLAPAREAGVSGRALASVALEGGEVRVALEGGGALVARAEGRVAPRAVVALEGVPPDPALVEALEARSVDALFERRAAPAAERPEGDARGRLGLLGPASRATGLAPGWLVVLALGLGVLASLGTHARYRSQVVLSLRGWLLGALGVAVVLRVALAATLPLETDEVRPLTSGMALFSEDHDAWLHPPLARALGTAWVELVGWRAGGAPLLLRAPFVLASALALAFLSAAAHRHARGAGPLGWFALGAVLVAPTFVSASVLARPYALTILLASVALFGLATRRFPLALAACGLAVWTDAIGGAMTALVVVASLARRAPPSRAALGILALALFSAPLVPGIAIAASHPVLAAHWDAAVAAGQAPEAGMAAGGPLSFAGRVAAFTVAGVDVGWLGLPALALAGWTAVRARRRAELSVALALALALALAIGLTRSVRPRNLVVLPLAFAALASAAARPREP